MVEEPQRDRERRQHQQVERAQRDRPPPVHQARDEQQAHRQQQPPAVDQPPVRVGQPARLHPADLRPGAHLGHLHPVVVHLDLGDLVVLGVVEPHRPDPVVAQRRRGADLRIEVDPVLELRLAAGQLLGRRRVQAGRRLGRRDVALDDRAVVVVDPVGGEHQVRADRLQHHRPGVLALVVHRLPVGAGVGQQQRPHLGIGRGDRDRPLGAQPLGRRRSGGGHGRQQRRRQQRREQKPTDGSSRACCQGSSPASRPRWRRRRRPPCPCPAPRPGRSARPGRSPARRR